MCVFVLYYIYAYVCCFTIHKNTTSQNNVCFHCVNFEQIQVSFALQPDVTKNTHTRNAKTKIAISWLNKHKIFSTKRKNRLRARRSNEDHHRRTQQYKNVRGSHKRGHHKQQKKKRRYTRMYFFFFVCTHTHRRIIYSLYSLKKQKNKKRFYKKSPTKIN